jgi:hypothetical protein
VKIRIQISPGELIDRLTILEIKAAALTDEAKLLNVRHELALQRRVRHLAVPSSRPLTLLERQLKEVNQELWQIEDAIREREAAVDFGDEFIRLARAVYFTNDRRCELKRRINELLHSELVEEKGYREYRGTGRCTAPAVVSTDGV